jgi:hypothetical protein
MLRPVSLKHLTLGLALISTVAIGGSGLVLAQDDEEEPAVSHPAHIHKGDCANLDPNPAGPLTNVEPRLNEDSDDEDANAPQGALTATTVLYSETEGVEVAWDDLLGESHAINVHESDENVQNYIACGDIGGVVVDDSLVIALHPQNDSGYFGIAIIEKNGDDKVDVKVYLSEPAGGEPDATPVA